MTFSGLAQLFGCGHNKATVLKGLPNRRTSGLWKTEGTDESVIRKTTKKKNDGDDDDSDDDDDMTVGWWWVGVMGSQAV